MLAYNQENFVRDAVECAFAQDLDGLEIILSDDCSTDGTYRIMQEMAEAYDGPNTVRVNRNAKNLGVNNHINFLVDMASADICIPFPGDDTSQSHRVSRLLEVMDRDDALLVHSDATTMDAKGDRTEAWHKMALFYSSTDPVQAAASDALYLGATAAYRRELFTKYGPLPSYSKAFEDLITGFRAALEGRVSYIDEPLVSYRNDVGISNAMNSRYRLDTMREAKQRREVKVTSRKVLMEQRIKDAKTFGLTDSDEILQVLKAELEKVKLRGEFYQRSTVPFLATRGLKGVKAMLSEINYIVRRK